MVMVMCHMTQGKMIEWCSEAIVRWRGECRIIPWALRRVVLGEVEYYVVNCALKVKVAMPLQ